MVSKGVARTEEWEVEASFPGKRSWLVSDHQLPRCSKESAQELCDLWHSIRPDITYNPVGYKVTRVFIKETA